MLRAFVERLIAAALTSALRLYPWFGSGPYRTTFRTIRWCIERRPAFAVLQRAMPEFCELAGDADNLPRRFALHYLGVIVQARFKRRHRAFKQLVAIIPNLVKWDREPEGGVILLFMHQAFTHWAQAWLTSRRNGSAIGAGQRDATGEKLVDPVQRMNARTKQLIAAKRALRAGRPVMILPDGRQGEQLRAIAVLNREVEIGLGFVTLAVQSGAPVVAASVELRWDGMIEVVTAPELVPPIDEPEVRMIDYYAAWLERAYRKSPESFQRSRLIDFTAGDTHIAQGRAR